MSWDTAKLIRGKAYVQEIELELDACKYTQSPYTTNRYATIGAAGPFSDSYTGSVPVGAFVPTTEMYNTWFGVADVCAKFRESGEIVSITVGTLAMTITARGLFGTTQDTINSGDEFEILHKGEADRSCRGYPHHCSSNDSYSPTAKLRPIWSTAPSVAGSLRFSGLKNIKFDDGEVDMGESIGQRASLSFDISDGADNDYFFNPYPDLRSSAGTRIGKMLARHPYLESRIAKYREGYRDPYSLDEPEWIERVFVIDTYKHSNEMLSVKALDPLVLTEDKKSKMPVASPARLLANLGTGGAGTILAFYDAPDYYFGAMSATIYIRIDSEVIVCTVTGATQLTVVTRGYRSTNKEHTAGATIQDCVRYSGTNGIDMIIDAIQNYTPISSAYLNLPAYADIAAQLPSFTFDDALITKPIAVVDFINDILKLGNLGLYFDCVAQEIVMVYTPSQAVEPISISESTEIKRSSVAIDDNVKNQHTRFSVLWGLTDITSDSDQYYAINYLSINAGLEADSGMAQVNERKSQKFPILANTTDDSLIGAGYSARVISDNEQKPKIVTINVDASSVGAIQGGELKKGSIVSLSTKYSQDKDGNNLADLYQVRKISGDGFNSYQLKMKLFNFSVAETVDFTISTGGINYDLSDYYTPSAGEYVIYIEPGVEFGSYDVSLPAFTTGTQSPGVSFRIINAGKILGMGGKGGNAGLEGSLSAIDGEDGGTALDITVPCEIRTASGLIWAGGGGGGAQEATFYDSPSGPDYFGAASGGNGAQGYGNSMGGLKTIGGISPTFYLEDGGSQSGAGTSGYDGGGWGEGGLNGLHSDAGLAGIAIKKNGNSVTIIDGNNDLNIKGRIE